MDQPTVPKVFNEVLCTKGQTHKNLPVVMVCIEKDCIKNRLCCLSCIDDLHCKHALVSIRKFETYLNDTLNHNVMIKNRDDMLKIIRGTRLKFTEQIEKVKNHCLMKIEEIEKKLNDHFNQIEDTFVEQKFYNVVQEIQEDFTEEKVDYYYRLGKEVQNNLVKSVAEISEAVQNTSQLLGEKIEAFKKQIDRNADGLIKVVNNFKIAGSGGANVFAFCEETKSAFLELSGLNKKVKRIQGSGGYPIVVVNEPFSELNNQINFMIVEEPEKKGIWMGVCVLDIVKNFNFQSCYGIGKGTWAIDQVGQNHVSAYSWSHHDTNYNSAPKVGFQFAVGEIINIKVDFEKSIVIFSKGPLKYEQPIKLDLGPIYAFAGPTNINDVISIV